MPVLTVTIMSIGALDEPAVRVTPAGNANACNSIQGWRRATQVAASGAVVSGDVV